MSKGVTLRISATDKELVDRGCALDESYKTLDSELDTIRDSLRREAGVALLPGVGSVELEGVRGVVKIVYPRTTYKLEESRIEELRRLLGPRYHEFVTEKTTFATTPDFETLYSNLPTEIRTTSTGLFAARPSTPRVTFGKIVGGQ